MKRVLIIDDDVAVTNYFKVFLMQTGIFDAAVINDSRETASLLGREKFDVVLLDMDMPNVSGIDILRDMRGRGIETPVVVLTGVSDVDLAVRAMKLGAFDYLIKPVDDESLLGVLEDAMEHSVLRQTINELPRELSRGDLTYQEAFKQWPSRNTEMIRLFHHAEKIASSALSIFIWGESGTGKEDLARAIHSSSPRRDKPFVALEAGSLDPEKFPSFFFGQAKDWSGAREEAPGILEQANGGTLFLDNIDAVSIPVQVRLKRVIQTGEFYRENSTMVRKVDVRMIVSSTQDLTRPEYKDRFSRDLLYHMMVNSLRIPPLRDRIDDIPLLAEHYLREEAEKAGKAIGGFSPELMNLLEGYSFPDNNQELKTIIASAVAKAEGRVITLGDLPLYIREKLVPSGKTVRRKEKIRKLDDVIREHVAGALRACGGKPEKAAEALGASVEEIERIARELESAEEEE